MPTPRSTPQIDPAATHGMAEVEPGVRIHYVVTCNNGQSTTTYTDVLGAQIHKNHGFSASGTKKYG